MASVSSLGLTGLPAPPSLQWAIFDRCRGLEEGREHEKILFFYPGTVTLAKQLQVTGLAEALLAFCASFGVDEAPSFSACQRHVVVYEEPEERIIMLIMADRQLLGSSVSHMQMRALLRDAHGMFCALHGPIRDLILDDGPTGATHASALLCALFGSICDHFLHGKHHGTLKELQNPLSRWTGVAHQPLNYALTLALQSFVLRATMPPAAAPAAACVADMVLLYKDSMLWSTLPRSDTHVLYLLALRSIIPACKASLKSAALTQIASAFAGAGAAGAAGAAAAAAAAAGSASASRPLARGLHVPSHPLLSEGCWMAGADGWARCRGAHLLTPRPQSSGSAPPMFIPTALPCGVLPVVRLDGGRGGWAPLACYNCNGLIVLLLLPEACALDDMGAVLRRTQDLVREHLGELPPILARLMQQVGKGHVPGYLYSVQDRASGTARASPSGKVSGWLSRKTLGLLSEAQESALALHTLQEPPLPAQHQEQQQQQQEEECTMSTLPHAAAAASRVGDLGPLPSPGRQQVELVTCGSSEGWVMTHESGTVASHFAWESRPTESLADVQHDAQTFLRDHLVGAMLPA